MASKNGRWAIVAFCGSLLTFATPTVTQAADQPKAKPDASTCRYLDSPGSRLKRRVCGTPAHRPVEGHTPTTGASFASPPISVPGEPGFSNPANQSAYQRYR